MSYLDKHYDPKLWEPYLINKNRMSYEEQQVVHTLNSMSKRHYYLFPELRERFKYNPDNGDITLKTLFDPNNIRMVKAKGIDPNELDGPEDILVGIGTHNKGGRTSVRMSFTLGPVGNRRAFKFSPAYMAAVLDNRVQANDPVVVTTASREYGDDILHPSSHLLYRRENITIEESDHMRRQMNPAGMHVYLK